MSVRYCGRDFTEEDLELIRSLAVELPTRTAIAEAACLALGWLRHDGRTAAMSARVALLRMARDGLVVLPPPRNGNGNGAIPARMEPISELPIGAPTTLSELGPIELVRGQFPVRGFGHQMSAPLAVISNSRWHGHLQSTRGAPE